MSNVRRFTSHANRSEAREELEAPLHEVSQTRARQATRSRIPASHRGTTNAGANELAEVRSNKCLVRLQPQSMAKPHSRAGLAEASFPFCALMRNKSQCKASCLRERSILGAGNLRHGREAQISPFGRIQASARKQAHPRPRHSGRIQIHGTRAG